MNIVASNSMPNWIAEIEKERRRQTQQEGYDAKHDAEHKNGELALAAACYAAGRPIRAEAWIVPPCGCHSAGECYHYWVGKSKWIDAWPWEPAADKRLKHDRKHQLVIAGALILAELERLTLMEQKS